MNFSYLHNEPIRPTDKSLRGLVPLVLRAPVSADEQRYMRRELRGN